MADIGRAPSGALLADGPRIILDAKTLGADNTALWSTGSTGTAAFATNKFEMAVASGQYVVRQTKHRIPYFSGYPLMIEMTCDDFDHEPGVTKRLGYFSSSATAPFTADLDGFWLESDGTTYRIVAYRNGVETVNVPFSQWSNRTRLCEALNCDPIVGPNFENFSVFQWDFLWLGGAALRLWVATPDGWVLAHDHVYVGTQRDTITQSPQHHMRYEIRGDSAAGAFRAICCQASVVGDVEGKGQLIEMLSPSGITCAAVGTTYALIGLKKSTTYRDAVAELVSFGSSTASVNDTGVLKVLKNPTLSAALSYSAVGKLQHAYATTQTVTANGTVLFAAPSSVGAQAAIAGNMLAWLTKSLTDVPDEYVLAFTPGTTNQTVRGILGYKVYG